MTPLITSVLDGDLVEIIKLLPCVDIDEINHEGNNSLWFACYREDSEVAALLIQHGIDINHQNEGGATALIYSASAGKTEMVELLLEEGADPSLKTLDDFTALDLAANRKILKMISARTNERA